MPTHHTHHTQQALAPIGGAKIHFEIAGAGPPFVMIHAGVADTRQWNNEFVGFSDRFRVLRYDQRGHGRSEPVPGDFHAIDDLVGLLDFLEIREPVIAMGCSIGGSLAMDFALAYPARVRALIMVGSGPSGLRLDVEEHPEMANAVKAYEAGDLDRVAELETRVWFDGMGRTPRDVDQEMRALALEMNRLALSHQAKGLGRRVPAGGEPAAQRLGELAMPVLVVTGVHDEPYIQAAHAIMAAGIPNVTAVRIDAAAHLLNMDQPDEFHALVSRFLAKAGAD
jgi:pimeloyl-ACP methyl ester carboxylesterase